jgi:hypothetical protein
VAPAPLVADGTLTYPLGGLLYAGFWLPIGIRAYRGAALRWPALLPANERGQPRSPGGTLFGAGGATDA